MMKTLYTVLCLTSLLAVSSCSKQDQVTEKKADIIEDKADIVRKEAEIKADAIERNNKVGVDKLDPNTPTDAAADKVRRDAEAKADSLENKADAVRETK